MTVSVILIEVDASGKVYKGGEKRLWKLGDQRKNCNNLDHSMVKIILATKKSTEDLMKFAVT